MDISSESLLLGVLLVFGGILPGKTRLDIFPKQVGYVEKNSSLTLFCIASRQNYSLLTWVEAGSAQEFTIRTSICAPDKTYINTTTYQFSCFDDTFNWTIIRVTEQQHGQRWYCRTNDTASSKTEIFVIVPVSYVNFSSPAGNRITVTENVVTQLNCTTSAERPRSTTNWYINGSSVPLGTGVITPVDNDTLASTKSSLAYSFSRNLAGGQVYCTAVNTDGRPAVESERKEIIVEYKTDGPPVIIGFINGTTFKAILSRQQSLVCSISGGYPAPTLTWDCFSGTTATEQGGPTEVRKRVTWTAFSSDGTSTCKCLANQKVSGQQMFMLNVDILYPPSTPTFSISDKSVNGTIYVIQGRSITVRSETSSNPSPTYKWTHDKTTNVLNGQNLSFQSVTLSDETSYRCTATNTMEPSQGSLETGASYSSFSLNVLFPPTRPTFRVGEQLILDSISVVKRDNFQVTCESTSDPGPPHYQWTGQSSGNHVLTINNIQLETTKTCTATNTMQPTVGSSEIGASTATLRIIVMSAPSIPNISYKLSTGSATQLSDENLLVIKGTSFSLECSGSVSLPAPTYRWSGRKTSTSYSVAFTNINTADSGQYTCIVENTMNRTTGIVSYGNISRDVSLQILYRVEVAPLQDQAVKENDPLKVNCTAHANPEATEFIWTRGKDGYRQQSSTLHISNTRRGDTDTYTCMAKNIMQPTVGAQMTGTDSKSMKVTILYFPDVVVSSLNGTALIETDSNIVVLCSAKGEPEQYTFSKWIQYSSDGHIKIREYNSTHIEGGKAYLTFPVVSYMDSGIYHCFVENGVQDYRTGNTTSTNSTVQWVKGKPIVTDGSRDVAAAKYEDSSLWVKFHSNDGTYPSVKWYRVKDNVRYNISYQDRKFRIEEMADTVYVDYYSVKVPQPGIQSRLFIQNIADTDLGDYEVEIENTIGRTIWNFKVVPQGAPELPMLFSDIPESATQTSIILTWRSGFHGGANQTFYIQQFDSSTSTWHNKMATFGWLLQDTDFYVTVEDLSPGTGYLFRIFAANVFGQSRYSTAITAKTRMPGDLSCQQQTESNTGAVAGWAVAGVLSLIIIAMIVLFVLYRKRRLPGCRQSNKNPDAALANIAAKNNNERSRTRERQEETLRTASSAYENANQHEYEVLKSTGHRTNEQMYDDLNPENKGANLSSNMQASPRRDNKEAVIYSNLEVSFK